MSTAAPRKRPRRWQQDPAGRRARILTVAARAFAHRGYRATRVSEVAREAQVSEGAVYSYFPTKRALLVAVGERYGQGLAQAAFGGLGPDFGIRDVEAVVRNIFRYVRDTEGSLAMFLLTNDPEEGGPAQGANRTEMLAAIQTTLERAMHAGRIAPMHPGIAAELQFGLVETALRDCFLRRDGAEEELYVREVTRALAAMMGEMGARRPTSEPPPPAPEAPR